MSNEADVILLAPEKDIPRNLTVLESVLGLLVHPSKRFLVGMVFFQVQEMRALDVTNGLEFEFLISLPEEADFSISLGGTLLLCSLEAHISIVFDDAIVIQAVRKLIHIFSRLDFDSLPNEIVSELF